MAKATKIRPYRIDYFDLDQVQGDRTPVNSMLIQAPTSAEAREMALTFIYPEDHRFIVRAYRFYKKLPKQSETLFAIEDLFTGAKAVEVMERIEKSLANKVALNFTNVQVPLLTPPPPPPFNVETVPPASVLSFATPPPAELQVPTEKFPPMPKDLFISYPAANLGLRSLDSADAPTTGPDSPATRAVIADLKDEFATTESASEWYSKTDRTINMMGFGPGITAGSGTTPTNSPAIETYEADSSKGFWGAITGIAVGLLVLGALYLYLRCH